MENFRPCLFKLSLALLVLTTFGCSSTTPSKKQSDAPLLLVPRQLSPEEAKEAVGTVGRSWLYGDGLGTAVLNVGTTVIFPPYGLFLLGNLALSASGYEALGVGMFLEDEDEAAWDSTYSSVVSGPGRLAAAVSGNEYVTPEVSKNALQQYTELHGVDGVMGDY